MVFHKQTQFPSNYLESTTNPMLKRMIAVSALKYTETATQRCS